MAFGGLLVASAFLGIYRDREFQSFAVFVKHRPSPRIYFSAPRGESDLPVSKLPLKDQREEEAFHVFVEVNRGYYRSLRVWN